MKECDITYLFHYLSPQCYMVMKLVNTKDTALCLYCTWLPSNKTFVDTDHTVHLAPRLRICGAKPPLPHVFMAWCLLNTWTTSPYIYITFTKFYTC